MTDRIEVTCDICGRQFWAIRWQWEENLNFPEDDTVCPACSDGLLDEAASLPICHPCPEFGDCDPVHCLKFHRYLDELDQAMQATRKET